MSEISCFLFFMPIERGSSLTLSCTVRPYRRTKLIVRFAANAIFLVEKLRKRKIGKLYTRERPEFQSANQLTARKADGGTASFVLPANHQFLAPFRLGQAPQHPAISRPTSVPIAGQLCYTPALSRQPHTGLQEVSQPVDCRTTSRQSDSNFPALEPQRTDERSTTLLTRPGTAACAMGKIFASASWGRLQPFRQRSRPASFLRRNFRILPSVCDNAQKQ
ncbi:hypothetical protein QBC45DRAFT_421873 [Copromyces sp. CBS 386.78]|nr:hypothetical protein QBC45DRAFT_421873 [Copromyces sp. CBS 386.78]